MAHGSRDPRAAESTEALARAVRRARPEWLVRAAYLDHAGPRPLEVLEALGARRAVLVPLLLTEAYHGRVDLPAVVAAAADLPVEVSLAEVLGPRPVASGLATPGSGPVGAGSAGPGHAGAAPGQAGRVGPARLRMPRLLLEALVRRLPGPRLVVPLPAGSSAGEPHAVGARGGEPLPAGTRVAERRSAVAGFDAVVLAAAGTRDATARATIEHAAAALGARLGVPATVSYSSGVGPRAGEAVHALQAAGAREVAVSGYFLAPGLLYDLAADSAREAGAVFVAPPLGDAPELVGLISSRVAAAGVRMPAAA
ncbi:sirohydrochlorin chelatase [Actinoplanes siamensis]|uniref:sirohydrochlorin chelatase n=1 Tax=Actinoplanes siamensis TaxID=1223317 RepID=UPI001EF321C2|nr:CbiX/SirB N-terminal domain-containing protein [Actinoplanes siamensis]